MIKPHKTLNPKPYTPSPKCVKEGTTWRRKALASRFCTGAMLEDQSATLKPTDGLEHLYVYIYMCIYIYIYKYVPIYIYIYLQCVCARVCLMHGRVCVCVCVYIYMYIPTYIHTYIHIGHLPINIDSSIYFYTHTHVSKYMHTYIRTYVHMYIHTYIPAIHMCVCGQIDR